MKKFDIVFTVIFVNVDFDRENSNEIDVGCLKLSNTKTTLSSDS